MKSTAIRFLAAFTLCACVLSSAQAVPVSVDLTSLRAIQTYPIDKGDDQAYVLVSGIANGKEFSDRAPKDAWTVGPKKPVATAKEPVTLWKGDLADGEFAVVGVTLMQGKGADAAKLKEYSDKKADAEKKAAARDKTKLAQGDFDKLHDDLLKADAAFIKDIKKIFSREAKTDHFNGLFTLILWNNGGKIVKRLDPVGLTFGEHFGTDAKLYTKIKNTRPNVMMKEENGEWSEQQLGPLSEDNGLRIKMTEVELLKKGPPAEKNTTDYLVEIQVKAAGQSLAWDLGGEQPGPTEVHKWWDFAE
jgi:hypothetical protein